MTVHKQAKVKSEPSCVAKAVRQADDDDERPKNSTQRVNRDEGILFSGFRIFVYSTRPTCQCSHKNCSGGDDHDTSLRKIASAITNNTTTV
jgi:hypothetical protein